MASKYLQKYPVPEGFHQILHDFAREVLRDQPDDIIKYGADYFECMSQGKEFKFESKYNIAKGQAPGRAFKPPKPSNLTEQAKIVVEKSNARPSTNQSNRVGSANQNNASRISSQGTHPEEKLAAREYVSDLYAKVTQDIDNFENDPNPQEKQGNEEEDLPKLTSFDDRDMQNIIKIQAAAKGKITRNQVKQQKHSKESLQSPEALQSPRQDETAGQPNQQNEEQVQNEQQQQQDFEYKEKQEYEEEHLEVKEEQNQEEIQQQNDGVDIQETNEQQNNQDNQDQVNQNIIENENAVEVQKEE